MGSIKNDSQCILTLTFRFPQNNKTNGRGKEGRGIGSHTDYGLLVIAGQDEVGGEVPSVSLGVYSLIIKGLFIRPPYSDEKLENWKSSAAGFREHDDRWTYVPPVPGVFTVFPGLYIFLHKYFRILIRPFSRGYDAVHDQLVPTIYPPQGRPEYPRAIRLRLLP